MLSVVYNPVASIVKEVELLHFYIYNLDHEATENLNELLHL